MRILPRTTVAAYLLCLPAMPLGSPAFASVVASSADDVCEAADDPCIVTDEIDIAPGSTLDFGLRTLRIEGGGVLDFTDAPATVRCGRLEVDVDEGAVAIRASGSGDTGAQKPGRRIEAVRQCSGVPRDCISEDDCDLGDCGVRRCALDPTEYCSNDGGCNFGDCADDGRCRFQFQRFCAANADCQAGPCGTQLTCRDAPTFAPFDPVHGPVACASNADCSLGDCTVGDGGIHLDGAVEVALRYPHNILIRAASDLVLLRTVEVSNDEGEVQLVSGVGNVVLDAPIRSKGEKGVYLYVSAGGDAIVNAPIDANGDVDAGQIALSAGNDLLVHDDLSTDTRLERDLAGEVYLRADRDIRIEGGDPGDPIEIRSGFLAEGTPGESDGDGGWVDFRAGRDVVIDEHARILVDGAQSTLSAHSMRDFRLFGKLLSTSSGSASYESDVRIFSDRDLVLFGGSSIESIGENGALPGELRLEAERDVDVSGSLSLLQSEPDPDLGLRPELGLRGCMVLIRDGAEIVNSVADSANVFRVRGGLAIEDGASSTCDDGPNTVRVRRIDNPFSIAGTMNPPADVAVTESLEPCPNCIDPESQHRVFCDDGVACTSDVCDGGSCLAMPDDSACFDPYFCDGSATCDVEAGCLPGTPVDCSHLDDGCYVGQCHENTQSCVAVLTEAIECDDGDECTDGDACRAGICRGRRDTECGDCGSATIEWGEDCDDGDESFDFGDACRANCQWTGCGHPTGSTGVHPAASDALYVLRTAVDVAECALAVCDANDSATIDATDALLVLRSAVGIPGASCPSAE